MMASAPGESYGGYEYEFVKEAPMKFICNICTKVQRDHSRESSKYSSSIREETRGTSSEHSCDLVTMNEMVLMRVVMREWLDVRWL